MVRSRDPPPKEVAISERGVDRTPRDGYSHEPGRHRGECLRFLLGGTQRG